MVERSHKLAQLKMLTSNKVNFKWNTIEHKSLDYMIKSMKIHE